MQTFVPYPNMAMSAHVLDRQRLGKQRVETLQLLNAITGNSKGWVNHPAAVMWRGHVNGLIAYGVTMCDAWINRGYKDTCREKILAFGFPDINDMPVWWGDERVHSSHRANLLRKDYRYYSTFEWDEDPEMPYYWPTQEESNV